MRVVCAERCPPNRSSLRCIFRAAVPRQMAARLGASIATLSDFSLPLVENMNATIGDNRTAAGAAWADGQRIAAVELDWNVFLDDVD
eukprot:SAG11_NODE_25256_length_361_cov_0.984733_1_plen_86_part_01